MCGIAGVRRFGQDPITVDQIKWLLTSLEHRGTDASGIALMNEDGELAVCKDDSMAMTFIKLKKFDDFIKENLTAKTTTALLHTRACTTGNPRDNRNNHPLTDGQVAIVHNGSVGNHEDLFKKNKFERTADTDSDIIRAYVSKYGIGEKVIREMSRDMTGSIAAACVDTATPDKLLLARSGSPLCLAKIDDYLIWASEKQAIHKAARGWQEWNNMWVCRNRTDLQIVSMGKDSAWIIGPKGLEFHGEFRTCTHYVLPDYTRQRTEYHIRQARWDREWKEEMAKKQPGKAIKVDGVKPTVKGNRRDVAEGQYFLCRNFDCDTIVYLAPNLVKKGISLTKLRCPDCHWAIEEGDVKLLH